MNEIDFQKKCFGNEYLEMYIEDGILYARYKNGVIIDLKVATKILKDRISFIEGNSYPTLVDGTGVKYWTREAREFQSSKENNVGMRALAMYVDSHVLNVIVKFYLLFNKPEATQACFTDFKKAHQWIEQFK